MRKTLAFKTNSSKKTCLNIPSLHNFNRTSERLLNLSLKPVLTTMMMTKWWSRTGSNRRPPACKAGALPAELRPPKRNYLSETFISQHFNMEYSNPEQFNSRPCDTTWTLYSFLLQDPCLCNTFGFDRFKNRQTPHLTKSDKQVFFKLYEKALFQAP